MKLKYKFVVRDVAGKPVAVTVGDDNAVFNGMVKLNDTAKFIFDILNSGDITTDELVSAVKNNYGIDDDTAMQAVDSFVATLRENGLIEE